MSIGGNRVQNDNGKLNYTKYNIVLLSFIRSMPNSIYNINNPQDNFQDSIDPMQLQ